MYICRPTKPGRTFLSTPVIESQLLLRCLEKVARKATTRPVSEWTDSNFIELSEAISLETGVSLSRVVLKRLYGKSRREEGYRPSKETRDALARYAGYAHWEELAKTEMNSVRQILESRSQPPEPRRFVPTGKPGNGDRSIRWAVGLAMLGLLLLGLLYWKKREKTDRASVPSFLKKERGVPVFPVRGRVEKSPSQ